MATAVGKAGDVAPGNMVLVDVGGEQVAVANVDGKFYGVSDICTHVGCSMHEGYLDGTTATCPCHGSQFDVTTGAVVRGPARDPLKSYAVEVVGDEIHI